MWDLPGPGLEPVSPELAGGFLTTVSPGKSEKLKFFSFQMFYLSRLSPGLFISIIYQMRNNIPNKYLANGGIPAISVYFFLF